MSSDVTKIDFDDIGGRYQMVPAGYEGLTWKNADYAVGGAFDFQFGKSGFDAGVASGVYASFNHDGTKPYVAVDKHGTFDLKSVDLTSAFYKGEQVTLDGYLDGKLADTVTVTVTDRHHTHFVLDFEGIDKLTIIGTGGTLDPKVKGDTPQVVLDNLNIVFHDAGDATAAAHSASHGLAGSEMGEFHPQLAIA